MIEHIPEQTKVLRPIRLDRFEALADRLEAQPERFDFRSWSGWHLKRHHCGTSACSLGHSVEMFGKECGAFFDHTGWPRLLGQTDEGVFDVAKSIFGPLTLSEYRRLFIPDHTLSEDCTAAEAAAEIRKFVAEQSAKVGT